MVRVGVRLGPFYISDNLRGRRAKYVVPKRDVRGLNPREKKIVFTFVGALGLLFAVVTVVSMLAS